MDLRQLEPNTRYYLSWWGGGNLWLWQQSVSFEQELDTNYWYVWFSTQWLNGISSQVEVYSDETVSRISASSFDWTTTSNMKLEPLKLDIDTIFQINSGSDGRRFVISWWLLAVQFLSGTNRETSTTFTK